MVLICLGCVAILLPAWLPNNPSAPIKSGTIELLQSLLLAVSAGVIFGASSHVGRHRPVCRVIGLLLLAGFVGEIEDFISGILKLKFPAGWVIGAILLIALVTIFRHRRVMLHFFSTLGNHAGSGFIAAALLILYVFDRMIGSSKFWQAALGAAYSPEIPKICRSYLELVGCYLVFIGVIGYSITMARRKELL